MVTLMAVFEQNNFAIAANARARSSFCPAMSMARYSRLRDASTAAVMSATMPRMIWNRAIGVAELGCARRYT